MILSDGCLRCHSQRDLDLLEGDPDAVPDDVVISVAHDAIDHWSSEQWRFLYQRLTPRLMSLVRRKKVDMGIALRAYGPHYADLASWPDDERRATEDAMAAELTHALEHRTADDIVELLGGLACAYDDLRPWLDRLDAATGPAAERGILRLAFGWATDLLWREDNWFTWWFTDDQLTPVREWTLAARPRVERFSRAHPECKTARDAMIAYEHLDRGEESPWWYPGRGYYAWQERGLPGSYGWLIPKEDLPESG